MLFIWLGLQRLWNFWISCNFRFWHFWFHFQSLLQISVILVNFRLQEMGYATDYKFSEGMNLCSLYHRSAKKYMVFSIKLKGPFQSRKYWWFVLPPSCRLFFGNCGSFVKNSTSPSFKLWKEPSTHRIWLRMTLRFSVFLF